MASRQARKSESAAQAFESDEENSQQSSQDADMLKAARDVVSNYKNRRETKRKVIEGDLKKRVAEVNAKVDAHFESRKGKVTKIQKAQWDRLDVLNKKREAIEAQINSSMRTVEIQTMNMNSELHATFSGRIEELQDAASPRT